MDADQFLDALDRVAGGGTALDPTVMAKLLGRPDRADPMPPSPSGKAPCWP